MAKTKAKAGPKAKHVYFFGAGKAEGRGLPKDILGGKGQGLAEMTSIRLPVPAGFTISVPTCAEYYQLGRQFPKGLKDEVADHIRKLEKATGKKFGDRNDPLLVSVRSGAARSMPGMMETILNLGLNDVSVEGFAKKTSNPRFAYDSYRRFIQMYSTTAMGLSKKPMEDMLTDMKERLNVKTDPELPAGALKELCDQFKAYYKKAMNGREFPQDPVEQLWGAVEAVFGSWEAEKAVTYRKVEKITDLVGTAVNVQQMVFGNMGDTSGTGVCFTRDPSTGENKFFGECLINAQGEDVVAGIRTPLHLDELGKALPAAYKQLCQVRDILEKHYKDMQDLEFTVQEEKLYMLQCRSGKRTPQAAFKMACDMVKEKLITREEALLRIAPADIERMFAKIIHVPADAREKAAKEAELKAARLGSGLNAVPGAAAGELRFTAHDAEEAAAKGRKVILIREETSPEDVGGMASAQGILTARGGMTSHAAVVARGWGKCCVVGAEALKIDEERKTVSIGGQTLKEGDWVTVDGSSGQFYKGAFELQDPKPTAEYFQVMKWSDEIRKINVRTNADSPADARKAIEMGAEGIGLCRTEHMFFEGKARQLAIQEMIVADSLESRKQALAKLLPYQRGDFEGIFQAMDGKPVTIRLIDPPLHEFTPKSEEQVTELSKATGIPTDVIKFRVNQLHEANPMLGHRGCRLCITYPEILEMQVTAIIEAAILVAKAGRKVHPEIMIPLTMAPKEFNILEEKVRAVADGLIKAAGAKVPYMVGTMIEIPRAALLADQVAVRAEFFSFGTNDLTQMTMGLSRDDAGRFLPDYIDPKKAGVFALDPFQALDQEGVGQLVKIGIERGRAARPNIKIGVCGEHGGELGSVIFFANAGMNYVSASPYRVPIARLAAAHAVILAAKAKKAPARQSAARKPAAKAVKKAAPAKKPVATKAAPAKKAVAKKPAAKAVKKAPAKKAPAKKPAARKPMKKR